jgi:hypothetical protein
MSRYIGEKVSLEPEYKDIDIKWMTREYTAIDNQNPSVWFIFNNKMYYGVCDYTFSLFEDYTDFKTFNEWKPGEYEWNYLKEFGFVYYELDYQKAILEGGDLDEWCDYELDFIKVWLRDSKLNELGI